MIIALCATPYFQKRLLWKNTLKAVQMFTNTNELHWSVTYVEIYLNKEINRMVTI